VARLVDAPASAERVDTERGFWLGAVVQVYDDKDGKEMKLRSVRYARHKPGVVSHHFHLLPEFASEDVLRDERVDTAHDVDHLGHAEAHSDAAQGVGVKLADLRLNREELDRVAGCERYRRL
jgi:hypothetical protein